MSDSRIASERAMGDKGVGCSPGAEPGMGMGSTLVKVDMKGM